MITITVPNKKIKINIEKVDEVSKKLVNLLDYHGYGLNIVFTDNDDIQAYNKKFRDIDKPTDILSFPFWSKLKPGQRIKAEIEDEKQLGDILISLEYVQGQLKELKTSIDERLKVLLVHGICHLLGYDHETDEQYAEMKKKEEELLRLLS